MKDVNLLVNNGVNVTKHWNYLEIWQHTMIRW